MLHHQEELYSNTLVEFSAIVEKDKMYEDQSN
jgi:hypothetical protein